MSKKRAVTYCQRPDRDVPGITCGYPLPCLHHIDVVLELRPDGASPEITTGRPLPPKTIQRLDAIGRALTEYAPRRGPSPEQQRRRLKRQARRHGVVVEPLARAPKRGGRKARRK